MLEKGDKYGLESHNFGKILQIQAKVDKYCQELYTNTPGLHSNKA